MNAHSIVHEAQILKYNIKHSILNIISEQLPAFEHNIHQAFL